MAKETHDQKRRAAESEQVQRATNPGPEPDTRHDSRGERLPEPHPQAPDDEPEESDEPEEAVLERQRRNAEELQQHGGDESDHAQR